MSRCEIFGCRASPDWQRLLVLRGAPDNRDRVEVLYCDACKVFWETRGEQLRAVEWPWVGIGWRSLAPTPASPPVLVF